MINIPSDIFENDFSCWLRQQTLICQAEDKDAFVFLEHISRAQMFGWIEEIFLFIQTMAS